MGFLIHMAHLDAITIQAVVVKNRYFEIIRARVECNEMRGSIAYYMDFIDQFPAPIPGIQIATITCVSYQTGIRPNMIAGWRIVRVENTAVFTTRLAPSVTSCA